MPRHANFKVSDFIYVKKINDTVFNPLKHTVTFKLDKNEEVYLHKVSTL